MYIKFTLYSHNVTFNNLSVLIHLEAERGQPFTADIEKHFGGILSRDVKLGLQVLGEYVESHSLV